MKKKVLPIFLSIIIFFTSSLIQVNKAQALTPQVAMAAGSGAGYAAVGAYVVGAMLVAGGAAVILDDPDSADRIREHGMAVWNTFDTATKQAWQTSIDATIAAGSATLEITDSMATSLTNAVSLLGNSAEVIVNDKNLALKGITPTASAGSYGFSIMVDGYKAKFNYNGGIYSLINISASDPDNGTWSIGGSGGSAPFTNTYQYSNFTSWTLKWYSRYFVTDYKTAISAWLQLGIVGALPVASAIDSTVPNQDYFNDSVDNALNRLKGIKEVSFDPKKWIPVGAGGALLVGGTAGEPLLEDGTPYTGDITWKHPELTLDDVSNPTVDAPSVPIDNVNVGDQPFVNDTTANPPATGEPTTGDTSGILQGLWDWLKGILQSILDAILVLGSLIGVVGLVQSILNLIETLSQSIDGWKNAPTKKIDWTKLTVAAGTLTTVFPFSIPWDVFRLFNVMNVQPITPVFEIKTNKNVEIFDTNFPIKYEFEIDFQFFNPIAAIGRWALILIFDISIIMALRRLTPD